MDGAGDYGNEKQAGEGVNRALKEGIVKREDLCESPAADQLIRTHVALKILVITSKVVEITATSSSRNLPKFEALEHFPRS